MQFSVGHLVLFAAAALGHPATSSLRKPSVTFSQGTVTGDHCSGNPNVVFFKSIPFAEPPLGELRYKPPKPLAKFPSGSIDGSKTAPACIQWSDAFRDPTPDSEDCLFINVWAPAGANPSSGLPVRVWIYGGGNEGGSISHPVYDSCSVVGATDAIQVSINFRLGPFGFMTLKEAGIQGNMGIQDMLLGLQWVQDNIAAFGGDPKRVVLFAQSAGAIDIYSIVTLPQAPKLMSAAVFESGAGRDNPLRSSSEHISSQYAEMLKCSPSDLACLQGKSVKELTTTYTNIPLLGTYKIGALAVKNLTSPRFAPCVDGEVVPAQPSLESVKVPSIIGTVAIEGSILAYAQYMGKPNGPADASASDYEQFVHENFGPAASKVAEHYPISKFDKTPYPAFYAMATITTHGDYLCNARRALVAAKKAGVSVWTYFFKHKPKCNWTTGFPQSSVDIIGPGHSVDLPFVFGHTTKLPVPDGPCDMTDAEKAVSQSLIDAWTAMAVHRKPVADPATWPEWDPERSLGVVIDNDVVPGHVDYSVCDLWDEIHQLQWQEAGVSNDGAEHSTVVGGGSEQRPLHESL